MRVMQPEKKTKITEGNPAEQGKTKKKKLDTSIYSTLM